MALMNGTLAVKTMNGVPVLMAGYASLIGLDAIEQALASLEATRHQPMHPPPRDFEKDPLRVALIGGGRLGQYYIEAFNLFGDTNLIAVVEPNPERAKAVCEKFGVPDSFRDTASMLAACNPEVVTIATPGAYFKEAVLQVNRSPSESIE